MQNRIYLENLVLVLLKIYHLLINESCCLLLTGGGVWPGELVMAEYLLQHKTLVQSPRTQVIELGCGVAPAAGSLNNKNKIIVLLIVLLIWYRRFGMFVKRL